MSLDDKLVTITADLSLFQRGLARAENAIWNWRGSRSDPNPFPRIHLFRLPRRELVLTVGAVASTWLAARYGMSRDEIVLTAVPVVGGWVVSEVVRS